ncbi:MAG TPA: GFA family protein [Gammaproteobacteria bacterium]|nr:GFA family protein [Gammaproteobacteria bacterium]
MGNLKGSCLCGEVNYELTSKIVNVVNCHCKFCRSHSGAAFSTYAALPYASLIITSGEEKLSSFKVEEGEKHFCSVCGTPIFNLNSKYPGACMVYFGTLESLGDIRPKVNVWWESKLGWVDSIASIHSVAQGVERKNA